MIVPQRVRWGPVDGRPAGIRVLDEDEAEVDFIAWSALERELNQRLMPQLFSYTPAFRFEMRDHHGKTDGLVQLVNDQGDRFCDVWFGVNPGDGWAFDGLVQFGDPDADPLVWQSYQRYSDGTYRRLPSFASSLDQFKQATKGS
ncbi:hypothetical protein [Bradyrhizobium arachidis]|uniref:hypothetical protein n=1 Tax=Bradyrhizobium arachidis TaxID=858423 RepID=UPI002161CD7D|nr:hypothetical protein [Bradyrhizobium arachidis]UVO30312.1 hypothetical protein KUF59_06100 [Bradyrhizobium arachidis]